uniref:Aquaporin n=1 Tax=Ditylenchus dipsaci TaxID=166011 RepID=A0A915CQY3_9BILA
MSANVQQASSPDGSIVSAQLAWGFGFAFAVYLAASVSGAHLNPAISFAALFSGDLSPPRFILYVFAQLLGAFSGTAIAYLGHLDDIKRLESLNGVVNETWTTAGLFATYPSEHITEIGSLFDHGVVPMLAGIVMSMVAMTFGANGGFAINPARDFSPRLFLLCVGYGWSVFSANDYYFWIPIVGPIIGALLGTGSTKCLWAYMDSTKTLRSPVASPTHGMTEVTKSIHRIHRWEWTTWYLSTACLVKRQPSK